ncbi:MAG: DNA polymerase/3'-5' exonuclease PolX, partial [Akkermansiaceae bacterium]
LSDTSPSAKALVLQIAVIEASLKQMANVTRESLISTLEEIALLLELKGENPFKTRAYRNGAEVVQNFDGDIVARAAENNLKGIKGIGDALQQKLHELASTGKLEYFENLRAEFPSTLFELFELQGLGPKKIKALYDKLGISSVTELKEACQGKEISDLSGFGAKTVEKILAAIENREKFSDRFRLGDVAPLAETLLERLRNHPKVNRSAIAGSYRRSKETLHDLDFLVATKEPAELTQFFTDFPEVHEVIVHGDTKASIRLENGLQCDIRAVSNAHFPFALQYFTGSKEHNVALRSLALKKGLSLNEYDFTGEGEIPEVEEEADIYRALGLDWVAPELRENRGEIEAARDSKLPDLVNLTHLRGTFHNHTIASDGKNTLEEMAAAAQDHGLEYLGIADHSKSSFQANGLSEERLNQQIDEIKKLNENFEDFAILPGSEVDILKDGSLDFDDDLLAKLDYCVASVHNVFNLPESEMTDRLIRAMENEHVTMLGHVTGRLLLKRDPYAVNMEKIIDCAAETRTVIELNCNPWRLDMDWRWWHRARDKNVLTSINPDAHATEQLQFLAYGARLARKGWLRREDVLNCLPLAEIRDWLALPKSKR